jgi:hypothetical protein
MIKSDAQRERTAAQIEGFRQALAKVAKDIHIRHFRFRISGTKTNSKSIQ